MSSLCSTKLCLEKKRRYNASNASFLTCVISHIKKILEDDVYITVENGIMVNT